MSFNYQYYTDRTTGPRADTTHNHKAAKPRIPNLIYSVSFFTHPFVPTFLLLFIRKTNKRKTKLTLYKHSHNKSQVQSEPLFIFFHHFAHTRTSHTYTNKLSNYLNFFHSIFFFHRIFNCNTFLLFSLLPNTFFFFYGKDFLVCFCFGYFVV